MRCAACTRWCVGDGRADALEECLRLAAETQRARESLADVRAALGRADPPAVEVAIAAGADVNALPPTGLQPPLHLAIEHQRVEIARRLIAAGAMVNCDLGRGWTPLVDAIDIESDAAWLAPGNRPRNGRVDRVVAHLGSGTGRARLKV